MEVNDQPQAPATLPLVKEPQVLTEQETGWAPEPVGSILVEEKSLVPSENGAPDCPGRIKLRLPFVGLNILKNSCLC